MRVQTKFLSVVLVLAILSNACGGSDRQRTLAIAEDDVAQGLMGAANVLTTAKQMGTIDQEGIDFIKPILQSVSDSNLEAIRIAREFPITGDVPLDQQQKILEIINFTSKQLVILNNDGRLRIKDPAKRLAFGTFIIAVQGAASTIVAAVVKKEKK